MRYLAEETRPRPDLVSLFDSAYDDAPIPTPARHFEPARTKGWIAARAGLDHALRTHIGRIATKE